MATETLYIEEVAVADDSTFSFFEKMMLRRFQPQSILIDVVGFTWFTYLFWWHYWAAAIAVLLVARLGMFTLVKQPNYSAMADTVWGRLALLHLHPVNMSVQLVGFIFYLAGLWIHSTPDILVAVSIVFLGHWFGWEKVHEAFSPRQILLVD